MKVVVLFTTSKHGCVFCIQHCIPLLISVQSQHFNSIKHEYERDKAYMMLAYAGDTPQTAIVWRPLHASAADGVRSIKEQKECCQ